MIVILLGAACTFGLFINRPNNVFLIPLFLIITNCIGLIGSRTYIGPISLANYDIALLLLLLGLARWAFLIELPRSSSFKIKPFLFLILSTVFILFIGSLVSYLKDDFFYGIYTSIIFFRIYLLLFAYLLFKLLTRNQLHDFLKFFVFASVIGCVYYIGSLSIGYSRFVDDRVFIRFPSTIIFSACIIPFLNYSNLRNFLLFSFLLFSLIFFTSLGTIAAFLAIIICIIFFSKRISFFPKYLIFIIFLIGIPYIYINTIYEAGFASIFGIDALFDFNSYSLLYFFHQGSINFRLGMLLERFYYVASDIQYALFGLGFLPDHLRVDEQIFTIGTDNSMLPFGFEQLNSRDILFPNMITRLGLVSTSLLIILYLREIIKRLFFSSEIIRYSSTTLFIISYSFFSFSDNTYFRPETFLLLFLCNLLDIHRKKSVLVK